jgi:hypothetical protein
MPGGTLALPDGDVAAVVAGEPAVSGAPEEPEAPVPLAPVSGPHAATATRHETATAIAARPTFSL